MLRSVASKAMWVGRTTAAVIGLAIALALVLGVATMALAAVPGDPFRLGQPNLINAVSALGGNVNNSMLRITNNSEGPDATALNLRVKPGKAPMTVNSTTEVQNLNVDQVDSKSASDFMTYNSTLKSGQTIVGVWGAAAGIGEFGVAPIEFRPKLPAAIPYANAHYVTGSSAPSCPGRGQADRGHLCVYVGFNNSMTFGGFPDPSSSAGAITVNGTILYLDNRSTNDAGNARGTWAVTAP